ncbi:MAG TPA: hypothetical protein ENK49_02945 [Gammaproteobacteria bacterium]|nr:hypothetical protein [Gammaproteobacteria bacterium]
MSTQHFSLQAMRATGRQRRLLWPLLTVLVLMLQPVQACCTLADGTTETGHDAGMHHPAPDSHCDMETADSAHLALAFRIRSCLEDIAPGSAFFPHITSTRHAPHPFLPPLDRGSPPHPPPWLLTRRLRI